MEGYVNKVPTPCYVIDKKKLINNLKILKKVKELSGCKILLAQKAFSMFALYPLIGQYLDGTTASSLFEAKLGNEEMGGETHIFAPAYNDKEFDEISNICDHIIFNSFYQVRKYKQGVRGEWGVRVNPEYSEQEHAIYDPCAPYSRLGIKLSDFDYEAFKGASGIHFHTLCEQDSYALENTLNAFESKFGNIIKEFGIKWVNFGGGHHITKEGYDVEHLIDIIRRFRDKYGVDVYLEPGEAIALNAGTLVSQVMDIVHNVLDIAIVDASAACHMPDVLEMPYRPEIVGAGQLNEKKYNYRFAGNTCLAGDVIGDYSFDMPLSVGDRIVLCDMAIYSMVKNNTFNGINLPSIAVYDEDSDSVEIIKEFGYNDFKNRLS
jgi:carboxynorspermidine decarboxylase